MQLKFNTEYRTNTEGHLISDFCVSSPWSCGREKQTDKEKEKVVTCFSNSAPYQALHDWLLHKASGFPVGTKKVGKKERNCMHNG